MTLIDWIILASICLAGAASPGPSLMVVANFTMTSGRGVGILIALAHGLGVGCYAVVAAFGLGFLLSKFGTFLIFMTWAGAIFLLYLAYRAFTSPISLEGVDLDPLDKNYSSSKNTVSRAVVTGFLTAFLNPKIALFFIAVYSQFLDQSASAIIKLMMAVVSMAVDALWYVLIAFWVSQPKVMAMFSKYAQWINRIFGILLILIAIKVVV